MELVRVWAATDVERAAGRFWSLVEERCPGLVPRREAEPLFAALGWLVCGGRHDDPAGRAALLTVLGRAYHRFGLLPARQEPVLDALTAVLARASAEPWTPRVAVAWSAARDRATTAMVRPVRRAGEGMTWVPGTVVGHQRPCDGVAILTVRPEYRLPYRPGQAVPVSSARLPGRWRWYSPANAPRPDGTIELHVRAVSEGLSGGRLSGLLVDGTRPGERLWFGPPAGAGLLLPDPPTHAELLLVAGGTGLAPLRALVEQLVEAGGRRVTLVVGSRTFTDLYDATSLDKLQCGHEWLTVVPAFSHDPTAEPAEVGDALTVALRYLRDDQEVYVCGPPAMIAGSRLRLRAAGVPDHRIHLADTFAG
ncbi:FAD-binding oxidoreductase [Micromonospora cathayae]|uniref:FAD-binding oxidoreductase n=1 Tax=Micromonospora cathayae TaxID=3028804 RepID=A0ABY7ZPG9_9ACTN|nr:FAD-binding oxidoreductase [Micromonospora sp. HUAS 3]WDZ84393.1 FAD-binding oxidoreductase [Micromonospora sp. HUAS 3]